MLSRTFCHVDTTGLTFDQVKSILKRMPTVKYDHQKGKIICKDFDQSRRVRDLRDPMRRANMRHEEEEEGSDS